MKPIRLVKHILVLSALLTSCVPNIRPQRIGTEVPDGWKHRDSAPTCQSMEEVCYWWEIFHDDTLNQLEADALAYNQTAKEALARVMEARALARFRGADLYPSIVLEPSASNTLSLIQTFVSKPGALPIPFGLGLERFHTQQYTIPFDLSYEIDVWGRVRNSFEAAKANAEAVREDFRVTLLTLTSDVAQNYFLLRSLKKQILLLQSTIELRRDNLKINTDRFNGGLVTYTDVSQAKALLAQAQADLIDAERGVEVYINSLAVLIGKPAPEFFIDPAALMGEPPAVPAGLPSEILIRRPDIARAEYQLRRTFKELEVSQTNFLPSFTLTGAAGLESPFTSSLFSWQARLWAWGLNSAYTVFDAQRNQSDFDAAEARYMQAIASYQQTILVAFKEVEDSLINIRKRKEQAAALREVTEASTDTYNLSNTRYKGGLVNYLEVVEAQRSVLESSLRVVQLEGQEFVDTILLIKALGGGWNYDSTYRDNMCDF